MSLSRKAESRKYTVIVEVERPTPGLVGYLRRGLRNAETHRIRAQGSGLSLLSKSSDEVLEETLLSTRDSSYARDTVLQR